jgi:hypothetical protein
MLAKGRASVKESWYRIIKRMHLYLEKRRFYLSNNTLPLYLHTSFVNEKLFFKRSSKKRFLYQKVHSPCF